MYSEYDLWFAALRLNDCAKHALLEKENNTKELYYILKENINYFNISLEQKNCIIQSFDLKDAFQLEERMKKEKCNVIFFTQEGYPKKLLEVGYEPTVLFYKGDIKKLNSGFNISIVGSRKASIYGKQVTEYFVNGLISKDINIVSGLAKGIDGCAQETAIKNNIYTCGILGCGIDVVYPKENKLIYDKILNNGCIISEFPLGTPPLSGNFPRRNRIISGVSDILIVIEASKKSGTLITATYAMEQGRDVYVVPGDIFSENTKGIAYLVQNGCTPIFSLDDLYHIINCKCEGIHMDNKNDILELSNVENKIYNTLTFSPMHIEDICKITKVDIRQLYEVLFELQFKNKIMSISSNYYVKKI